MRASILDAARDSAIRRLGEEAALLAMDSARHLPVPVPVAGCPGLALWNGIFVPRLGGGAITTYDGLISALGAGKLYDRSVLFPAFTAQATSSWASSWQVPTGVRYPAAGTNPSASTARLVDSTITGALTFPNPGGTDISYFLQAELMAVAAGAGGGGLWIVDRLLDYSLAVSAAGTLTLTNTATLPSRDVNGAALGDGVQMFYEVSTVFGAGAATLNATYTNQAGTGSKTTGAVAVVATSAAGRLPLAVGPWVPLAAGDTGVRSVQSVVVATGTTTGVANLVLCRPIVYVPLGAVAGQMLPFDCASMFPRIPKLYNSQALMFILTVGSNSAFGALSGTISAVQG